MATYREPSQLFARLEVIERLLKIRAEMGFLPAIFLHSVNDLAFYMDAFGFDVYVMNSLGTTPIALMRFYRSPIAPGGEHAHLAQSSH